MVYKIIFTNLSKHKIKILNIVQNIFRFIYHCNLSHYFTRLSMKLDIIYKAIGLKI